MPLPLPNSGERWENYRIKTSTFKLTPIEKPDMSPFLVHMTGKDQIIQILEGKIEGKNVSENLGKGNGFLKANVPVELDGKNYKYKAKVVCFTESPTFALDFFRYRNYRRWSEDQRFGIGFDKANLVSKGIRPVIYADKELTQQILTSYDSYLNRKQINKDKYVKTLFDKLVEVTYPLLFPLLEDEEMGGFMWEREWRATEENGFVFSHKDIRIICCPPEEKKGIRDILGNSANDIQFIYTWIEYDDVTRFLERQQQTWKDNKDSLNQVEQKDKEVEEEDKEIEQILALIEHRKITNNSLKSYHEFILRIERNKEKIEKQLQDIPDEINNLETQLAELKKKKEAKKKVQPDSSVGNTNSAS